MAPSDGKTGAALEVAKWAAGEALLQKLKKSALLEVYQCLHREELAE